MNDKITCPHCGNNFDVEEVLSVKYQAQFKAEAEKKIAEQASKFNAERQKLAQERDDFARKKEKENELFAQKLKQQIAIQSKRIEQQTLENFEEKIKLLEADNLRRKEENRTLKAQELDLMKRENILKERSEELELNLQKQLLEKQKEIEEKAREKEREAMLLKEKEYQKQLEDQKKLIDEMKRKAEQGSMQLQGEVQELALEDLLTQSYPFDKIAEVPKGIRGADTIQTVVNSGQQECGKIVYESKRTKNFSNDWIDKLKQDQITCKADVALLVTETMPSDMQRFGQKKGIWICGFHEVKSLSLVLREMLLRTYAVKQMQENKGDKKEMLYNYVTSNEFGQHIQRIAEIYNGMHNQLEAEKKSMQRIWAARDKQIVTVQENLNVLFGSILGYTTSELESNEFLQLPDSN